MPSRTSDHPANALSALQDPTSAVNTILSGRKCWRILKGRNEPVWPPPLEAALIEGLSKYKPTGSRSTKALGRLPMRNKFVSDYIYETTGKRRTPKQVGSRIQQLRDTNSGKHIVKVLSDQHYDMLRPARSNSDDDGINENACMGKRPATNRVEIPVSPPQNEPRPSDYRYNYPPPLRDINPAVTFLSATKIDCQSTFIVYQNNVPIASETTKPECQLIPLDDPSFGNARYIYSTLLVPSFWPKLCSCSNPTQYTISQEILREDGHQVLSSVEYHFVFASSPSRSLSPASVDDGSSVGEYASSTGSSSNQGAEFEHFMSHSMHGSPTQNQMGTLFESDSSLLYSQSQSPMYSNVAFGSEPASPLNATMPNLMIFPQNTLISNRIPSNTSASFSAPGAVCDPFFTPEQGTSCYSSMTFPDMAF